MRATAAWRFLPIFRLYSLSAREQWALRRNYFDIPGNRCVGTWRPRISSPRDTQPHSSAVTGSHRCELWFLWKTLIDPYLPPLHTTQLDPQQHARRFCKFWIFNSSASLNLHQQQQCRPPRSPPNAAPLPPTDTPTANEDYNAGQAVVSFTVIVKPAFTKHLEETQTASTKRVTQEKYNDILRSLPP